MLELMANINAYLLSRVTPYAEIVEDFFPGDSEEELMCRHDPSPLVTKQYLNGSAWKQFSFSYYAKSRDVVKARQQLEAFIAVLELDGFTDLFGAKEGRLTVASRPSVVSKTDGGVVTYTSSYRLVYFQEE